MSRAWVLIRERPWYRKDAFVSGLNAVGYEVCSGEPNNVKPDDVLVSWNRYGAVHDTCTRFERDGGICLISENGYLGVGGTVPKWDVHPSGPKPDDFYSLAIGGHNGSGSLLEGSMDRWSSLRIALQPLRRSGGHILICPSRPFGRPDMIQPASWLYDTLNMVAKNSKLPGKVRMHPGNDKPIRPLSEDLKGAHAVVIWASSAGVHALIEGIPVICGAPYWIAKGATCSSWRDLEVLDQNYDAPNTGAPMWENLRLKAMQKLAWSQWTCAEIESGEPFRHLLRGTEQAQVAISS